MQEMSKVWFWTSKESRKEQEKKNSSNTENLTAKALAERMSDTCRIHLSKGSPFKCHLPSANGDCYHYIRHQNSDKNSEQHKLIRVKFYSTDIKNYKDPRDECFVPKQTKAITFIFFRVSSVSLKSFKHLYCFYSQNLPRASKKLMSHIIFIHIET